MWFKKNATNSATNKKKALQSLDYQCLLKENVTPLGTNIKTRFLAVILDFTNILKNLLQYS
jgi:hypothetical protein